VSNLLYLVKEEGAKLVAFTYNEPLMWYEYILEAAPQLVKAGIKTVLVTNGYINPKPLSELLPYIDAYSLDIKWSRPATAKKLSGALKPQAVFEFAKIVFLAGKHLEIVTNIVHGYNDSDEELAEIARFIVQELSPDVPWHLSRAFPAHKLLDLQITPRETLERAAAIGRKSGLRQVYLGNI
jgi:pyruvate formate lyase activating enzyme